MEESIFTLVALRPSSNISKRLEIIERKWRPARSIMAIANKKVYDDIGLYPIQFESMVDLDDNASYGITNPKACRALAKAIRTLLSDPFAIVDYGMTMDIDNGVSVYTYPTNMCTAYFEDVDSGELYETLNEPNIIGKRVRSWFRISEDEMSEVTKFIEESHGFHMP